MNLHCLQHVPFEGLGSIETWARQRNARIGYTRFFRQEPLPAPADLDLLVVMGGPMGVHDAAEYPWLTAEKAFIRQTIEAGKTVLGICLGAQLIADVLGAPVRPGPHKEIGWFPIKRCAGAPALLPADLMVFHWHGDTFGIPAGAVRLASSAACSNQGFIYGDRVIGLQFHMETTVQSLEALIENCRGELSGASGSVLGKQSALAQANGAGCSVTIQTAEQMRAGTRHIAGMNAIMNRLLDRLPGITVADAS